MSTISVLIAAACINASGPGKEACSKGLEAGSKQSGIEQQVNDAKDRLEDKAKNQARDIMGETGVKMVGSTFYLAKVVSDKAVSFRLPTFGICDKITSTAGVEGGNFLMEWSF